MTIAYLKTPEHHTLLLTDEGGVPSLVADHLIGAPTIFAFTCLHDFVLVEQSLREMKDEWLRKNSVLRS